MKIRIKKDEQAERTRTKRLFLWMIISGLVCAAIAVSVFVYFFVPRDKDINTVTIPSFLTMSEKDIRSYDGISVKREWIYSSEVDEGKVISQKPYAGARRKVKAGRICEVTVFISLGEKTETVPQLCGVEEMSAAAALRSLGARVRRVAIYGDGEEGRVLYTSPRSGSKLKEGDTVTIFVSKSRAEEPITVPDLCGLELAEAYRRALELGLCISDGEVLFLNSVVTEQSIPQGARVKKGSYISFRTEEISDDDREWPPFNAENR